MILIADYWMGRDRQYKTDLTHEIIQNALITVERANLLLSYAAKDGVYPGIDQVSKTPVASGWRPAGVNSKTSNAADHSPHLLAMAVDLQDTWPKRDLARWCVAQSKAGGLLERCGLWMEDPRWTCTENKDPWVHVQIIPPRSGNRIFIPSSATPWPGAILS